MSYGDVKAYMEKNKPDRRVYVYKETSVYCGMVDDDGALYSKRKDSKDLRPWDWVNDAEGCAPKYCPRSGPHVVGQDRVWEVWGVGGAAGVQDGGVSAVGAGGGEGGGADVEAAGDHADGSASESSAVGEVPHPVGDEGN